MSSLRLSSLSRLERNEVAGAVFLLLPAEEGRLGEQLSALSNEVLFSGVGDDSRRSSLRAGICDL